MKPLPMMEHGEFVYAAGVYPTFQLHDDPRTALGSVERLTHWPDSLCDGCFDRTGALIQATGYDNAGRPCCAVCAGNGNRRVS